MNRHYYRFKCLLDAFFSLILLLILSLLLLILLLLGVCFMGGRPGYRQLRLGKNQKAFYIYKFRSFRLYRNGEERINWYGRVLRKLSLDELPQLLNILGGQMSFVGPRPLAINAIDIGMIPLRQKYGVYQVRPGLTGLAQIHGRVMDHETKAQFDKQYVEKLSFGNDAKILFQTFGVLFKNKED